MANSCHSWRRKILSDAPLEFPLRPRVSTLEATLETEARVRAGLLEQATDD
jgi:hypothetical protein